MQRNYYRGKFCFSLGLNRNMNSWAYSREFCVWHLGANFREGGRVENLHLEFIDFISI